MIRMFHISQRVAGLAPMNEWVWYISFIYVETPAAVSVQQYPLFSSQFPYFSSHLSKIAVEISLRALLSPVKCPLPFSHDPLPLCDSSYRNQHFIAFSAPSATLEQCEFSAYYIWMDYNSKKFNTGNAFW